MNELKKHVNFCIKNICRNKFYWLQVLGIYLLSPLISLKPDYLTDHYSYATHLAIQQLFILISLAIPISILIKDDFWDFYEDMICIHLHHKNIFFYSIIVALFIVNFIPFLAGQFLLLVLSRCLFLELTIYNIGLIACQLTIGSFTLLSLLVLFKKNFLAYLGYILYILLSIFIQNSSISLPLLRILTEDQAFYLTLSPLLWFGRLTLLIVVIGLFHLIITHKCLK